MSMKCENIRWQAGGLIMARLGAGWSVSVSFDFQSGDSANTSLCEDRFNNGSILAIASWSSDSWETCHGTKVIMAAFIDSGVWLKWK